MSTKIYNGIKFRSDSIVEIISQLREVRKDAVDIAIERILPVEVASYVIQKNIEGEDHVVWYEAYREFTDMLHKRDRLTSEPSILFSVVIFPLKDNEIYGIYLDDGIQWYSELLIGNIAEEYSYCSNIDRPEAITEEEWGERSAVWGEVLSSNGLLTDTGMEFYIVREQDIPAVKFCEEYQKNVRMLGGGHDNQ